MVFCWSGNTFSAVSVVQNFNNVYTGTLNNKNEVVFSLKNTGGKLSGFYYYNKIGVEISLIGELASGTATIYELDYQGKKQAKITGQLSAQGFTGKWESLTARKVLPLKFKQTNKSIPNFPKNLVSTYVTIENDCAISINISKIKNEYFYHFKSKARTLKGKVTFSRSLDENLVYINFNGIEWAENSGDVTDGEENAPSKDYLPTVVQGLLNEGEIIIQNYGNALNRYVKLDDCGEKYIHLKRKL